MVVVCLQYRLGVFGFIALEELKAEAGSTGNYGMMDQQEVFKWANVNVFAFGGSMKRLIAWGGWADGAVSACYHLVSPLSKGMVAGAPWGSSV